MVVRFMEWKRREWREEACLVVRASFNRKIRFSIIQRDASFSGPKGAARPIFEEKSVEKWFPLLFLRFSPLRLEIFTTTAIDRSVFFPHFFRFTIEKSYWNIWTIERERETKREFDRCCLKSFFKGNEETKDLFPRVIRVSKNMGGKKKLWMRKISTATSMFRRRLFRFFMENWTGGADCFEMFEIPLLIEDKPDDSRTTVKRAQLDYSLVIPIPLSRTSRPLVITIKVLITFKLARPSGCLEFRIVIWIGPWTRLAFSMKRLRDFALPSRTDTSNQRNNRASTTIIFQSVFPFLPLSFEIRKNNEIT